MSLRLVRRSTARIAIGEDDWLDVRQDISRRQFNELMRILPDDFGEDESKVSIDVALSFSEFLFETFVVDWSVRDELGEPVEANLENYQNLTREAASLVDEAVREHFNSLSPSKDEVEKSEEDSGTGTKVQRKTNSGK